LLFRTPSATSALNEDALVMRSSSALAFLVLMIGCSAEDNPVEPGSNGGTGARGGSGGSGGSGLGEAGSATGPELGELGAPTRLAIGTSSITGVTSDGWAVYREGSVLQAARVSDEAEVQTITDRPGSVIIKGRVVFNWADVDWEQNVGDLSIWSEAGGAVEIGPTRYAENLIASNPDGTAVVYVANESKGTTDLMIAPSDLSQPQVLIEAMGLGSETTCGPSLGFVGDRLFVGWCSKGKRDGKIQRFELEGGEWKATDIAESALPAWSADSSGERILYQSNAYEGFVSDAGESVRIDASVSRGFVLPDGSAILYTVGDQLRRTELPDPNPVAVVTTGYSDPVGFSPDYSHALYSSRVSYESGTRRDLRLVATEDFNPEPIELVAEPEATLPRSSMTKDGQYVLYLGNYGASGGDLHVVDMSGTEVRVLPNVLEALAIGGSRIAFTSEASDPEVYPVVSDLYVLDLASDHPPTLVEARILDGKNFQLASERIVYLRSGVDRDAEDPERNGMFYRQLP
jgi:hypothetical protein